MRDVEYLTIRKISLCHQGLKIGDYVVVVVVVVAVAVDRWMHKTHVGDIYCVSR